MSLRRPAIPVDDFHPFAMLNRRAERHIAPYLRHKTNGLFVLAAIATSVFTLAMIRRPLPKTISDEWKEAERKRDAIKMDRPIATSVSSC